MEPARLLKTGMGGGTRAEVNAINWCIFCASGAFFAKGAFTKQLRQAYERLEIFSEADLQARAWLLIRSFLRRYDSASEKFRVLNKLYFKDLQIHPDLAIFRRKKPWVLIELKERSQMSVRRAKKERNRLIKAKKALNKKALKPKRAYLIYVARWGKGPVLRGPKGPGARFFFEIPMTLQDVWPTERITAWEEVFHKWANFVVGGR